MTWSFRRLTVADLPALLILQERGAVAGLADVFPQDSHPFPRGPLLDRWRAELDDPDIAAYAVSAAPTDELVAFAARRGDELLHLGTALETWGSGLAAWTHDRLLATYPPGLGRLRLRVFEGNTRARHFYEKLGWEQTGARSASGFPPYPVLFEYTLIREPTAPHGNDEASV